MKKNYEFLIKKLVGSILTYSGFLNVCYPLKKINGNGETISLMYHRVVKDYQRGEIDLGVISATEKNFEEQMKFLSEEEKYKVISLEDFVRGVNGNNGNNGNNGFNYGGQDLFELKRIGVEVSDNLSFFQAKLLGIFNFLVKENGLFFRKENNT